MDNFGTETQTQGEWDVIYYIPWTNQLVLVTYFGANNYRSVITDGTYEHVGTLCHASMCLWGWEFVGEL